MKGPGIFVELWHQHGPPLGEGWVIFGNSGFVHACQHIPDVYPIRRDLVVPMLGYPHLSGGNKFVYCLKGLAQLARPLALGIDDT